MNADFGAPMSSPDPGQPIRTMPLSYEAEQDLIGSILMKNNIVDDVGEFLKPEHFAEPTYGRIFAECQKLSNSGRRVDAVVLKQIMANDAGLAELGGDTHLAHLCGAAVSSLLAIDHAKLIFDLYKRRELIAIGEDLIEAAFDVQANRTADTEQEEIEQRLFMLSGEGANDSGPVAISKGLSEAISSAEALYKADGKMRGLPTGFIDLDGKTGGLHTSDLVILAGRPSMGKAQPLDAKILMADGSWKTMRKISFGDHVASVDGSVSYVSGIFPQGKRQVYRIIFKDGRSTMACGEHLWGITTSRLKGDRVVSTDELRRLISTERYRGRVSVPLISGHFGQDREILIDPWLLGVLIGNGTLMDRNISVSTADAATLFRVQQVVGSHRISSNGDSGYDYRITQRGDSSLVDALERYGLLGKRSEEKFIPPEYLSAALDTRMEILRGLLDTDGWVETFGAVRFATGSRCLAEDVQSLVRSIGGTCSIREKHPTFTHKGEKRKGLTSYTCNITHPDRGSLLTLTRKQRRCKSDSRFRSPTIVSIEPDGFEEVQCIQVTHPSALYVTDDYVVTHNTALATNIAVNIAKRLRSIVTDQKRRIAFFSLEMSCEQLAQRILSAEADVSGQKFQTGNFTQQEMERLADAQRRIDSLPMDIDDTPALTVAAIRTRSRRIARQHGLAAIVIDYLQLIGSASSHGRRGMENRTQEVSEITRSLKALAKELNVPVLALSQLSRQVEQREDKRPQLSDLRESGSIEQDADVVMFVFREEYYLERSEPSPGKKWDEWNTKMEASRGIGEVVLAKQRRGPVGIVRLHFNGALTVFQNLDRNYGGGDV